MRLSCRLRDTLQEYILQFIDHQRGLQIRLECDMMRTVCEILGAMEEYPV